MKNILWGMSIVALVMSGASVVAASPTVADKLASGASDGSYTLPDEDKPDDVQILEAKDIALLSDDKLTDAYMDVLVELEASRVFHATSGFTPKEYKRYKSLLKYRMQLLVETHRRKLEVPTEAK